jgi:hypothetical protein
MGRSIEVTATGTAYSSPCKLLRIIVKPGGTTGSFTVRDGGAAGRIVASDGNVPASGQSYSLEVDHDCKTDLHVTISNCAIYCVIR